MRSLFLRLFSDSYLPQSGPDPNLARGPDANLTEGPSVLANGADEALCNGPSASLAAGSDATLTSGPTCLLEAHQGELTQAEGGVCNNLMQAFCLRSHWLKSGRDKQKENKRLKNFTGGNDTTDCVRPDSLPCEGPNRKDKKCRNGGCEPGESSRRRSWFNFDSRSKSSKKRYDPEAYAKKDKKRQETLSESTERRERTWQIAQCTEPCCEGSSGRCKADGSKGKKSKRKGDVPEANDRRGKISWENCNGRSDWPERNGRVDWSDRNGRVDWSQRNGKVDMTMDRKGKGKRTETPGCSTPGPSGISDHRRLYETIPEGHERRERRLSEGSTKSHKKDKRKSSLKKVPTVTKETLDGKDYYLVVLVMPEPDS